MERSLHPQPQSDNQTRQASRKKQSFRVCGHQATRRNPPPIEPLHARTHGEIFPRYRLRERCFRERKTRRYLPQNRQAQGQSRAVSPEDG